MLFEVVFKKDWPGPNYACFNDFLSEQPKLESESALRALAFHHHTRSKYVNEGPQIRMDGSTIAGSMQFMSG